MANITFQELLRKLQQFWQQQDCIAVQPLDLEIGAGTFHPATFLKSIGPEPWNCAYPQPCRRPSDGRYGKNPNRLQHYYQFQVIMKPVPSNFQDLYLQSLDMLGIDREVHDVRFVEDNWESPTLGAWGLGWEVWLNGMEITQFTYFQQVGGLTCKPITGEITYGLERLAMYLQEVNSVYDIIWHRNSTGHTITYGDIFQQNEREMSHYNFDYAHINTCQKNFEHCIQSTRQLVAKKLPLPAYEQVIKASHYFNLLDARNSISVTERQHYILKVRQIAQSVAKCYFDEREKLGFPLAQKGVQQNNRTKKTHIATVKLAKTAPLLIEILCEELPPQSVEKLAQSLQNFIYDSLKSQNLLSNSEPQLEGKPLFSPRRIVAQIANVRGCQQQSLQTIIGPKRSIACNTDGTPSKIGDGFAKKHQLNWSELQWNNEVDPKLVATKTIAGISLAQLLPDIVDKALKQLPIAKRMRWGKADIEFVRPVISTIVMHGKQVIPLCILGTTAGNQTLGHRIHSQGAIVIDDALNYESTLEQNGVYLDQRLTIIRRELKKIGVVDSDETLLKEVNALVEYPRVLTGQFNKDLLALPKELLIESMQKHQKYFPIYRHNKLSNKFAFVANLASKNSQQVIAGNEKVLLPRLEDCRFFIEQDKKTGLATMCQRLKNVTYQQNLGTLFDKTERVARIAADLNHRLRLAIDPRQLQQVCALSKADLVSLTVQEFPSLQGTIGKYYALAEGIDSEVADAIEQHYWPKSAYGTAPQSLLAGIVALADRLDTLTAMYVAGKVVSGSRDPFALRRTAIAINNILMLFKIDTDLPVLLGAALDQWEQSDRQATQQKIIGFILDRAKNSAVLDITTPESAKNLAYDLDTTEFRKEYMELAQLTKRLETTAKDYSNLYRINSAYNDLYRFKAENKAQYQALMHCKKRVGNFLKGDTTAQTVNKELFESEEERDLYRAIRSCLERRADYIAQSEYYKALEATIKLPVVADTLFDNIVINAENVTIKNNRIALICLLNTCLGGIPVLTHFSDKCLTT